MFHKLAEQIANIATELDGIGEVHAAHIVDDLLLDISRQPDFSGAFESAPILAENESVLFSFQTDNGIFDVISIDELDKSIAAKQFSKTDLIKAASADAYANRDIESMTRLASSSSKFESAIEYFIKKSK